MLTLLEDLLVAVTLSAYIRASRSHLWRKVFRCWSRFDSIKRLSLVSTVSVDRWISQSSRVSFEILSTRRQRNWRWRDGHWFIPSLNIWFIYQSLKWFVYLYLSWYSTCLFIVVWGIWPLEDIDVTAVLVSILLRMTSNLSVVIWFPNSISRGIASFRKTRLCVDNKSSGNTLRMHLLLFLPLIGLSVEWYVRSRRRDDWPPRDPIYPPWGIWTMTMRTRDIYAVPRRLQAVDPYRRMVYAYGGRRGWGQKCRRLRRRTRVAWQATRWRRHFQVTDS